MRRSGSHRVLGLVKRNCSLAEESVIMQVYEIERLGHQGDGVANGPIFAYRTLPGETVSGDLVGNRLENVRIVTPSSERIKAICPHYKACGGCQVQHASDEFVVGWKTEIVEKALSAHGLSAEFLPIKTSPARSRRRAAFSAKRTKKGATAGFHKWESDVIVEVPDCEVLHQDLAPALDVAKQLALLGASRKSELSVTATATLGGLDISVIGGKPLDRELNLALSHEVESANLARLTWDGETVVTRNQPSVRFGPAEVVPPPGAFLQATEHGQEALVGAVLGAIGTDGKKGIDLFSGCGTFTLPLAETFEMHGVEGQAVMLDALDQGWRRASGLKRITTAARDLFRNPMMAEELAFDFAVIDPPRAGAEAQIQELARSDIARIAYVSCNPVTFARDAEELCKAGFDLEWIQVVDQFRWSVHVELAAKFSRR